MCLQLQEQSTIHGEREIHRTYLNHAELQLYGECFQITKPCPGLYVQNQLTFFTWHLL